MDIWANKVKSILLMLAIPICRSLYLFSDIPSLSAREWYTTGYRYLHTVHIRTVSLGLLQQGRTWHELLAGNTTWVLGLLILKNGPIPVYFCVNFRLFNMSQLKFEKASMVVENKTLLTKQNSFNFICWVLILRFNLEPFSRQRQQKEMKNAKNYNF